MTEQTRIQELERENAQLRKQLEQQARDNTVLRAQLEQLQRELEEWRRGHRARPRRARHRCTGVGGKKPGGKPGHVGHGRPYPGEAEAEREEHHSQEHCPRCGQHVVPTGECMTQYVEELVPARRRVVAHRQYGYFCPGCQHEGVAPLPPELGPAPKLDVSVQAEVVSLHYEYGLSYGQIAAYRTQRCQFPVSGGAIAQICVRTAQRTVAAEQELQEVAQRTRVVHMDETTWWTSGVLQYLWLVATAAFSWFRVDPRRSHAGIVELLGKGARIVISDYYSAYRACTWLLHQWCWAHLIRDAKRIAALCPTVERLEFRDRLIAIYKAAVEAQSREGPEGEPARRVIGQRLGKLRVCLRYAGDPELERLQRRLHQEFSGYLAFVDDPEVAPDNNRAERDLRPAVLLRKRSFQTRSEAEEVAFAHWMSLTQTLRKQGLELEPWLRQALAAYGQGTPLPSVFAPEPHPSSLPN
jgi:transposase